MRANLDYTLYPLPPEELALICSRSALPVRLARSLNTVRRWFIKGRYSRHPNPADLRHLALMDFLLEHFEKIPKPLLDLLCP
ncbi:MAG TPA: hypothetical protein V6D14_12565 [Coleofasciculaceae cyanobacterium]